MSNAAISPRARWSMTLRSNSRNLEDRKGYEGTSRGLLWGGECAKVIDSQSYAGDWVTRSIRRRGEQAL